MKALIILAAIAMALYAQNGVLKRIIDGNTVSFEEGKCFLAYISTPEATRNLRFNKTGTLFEDVPKETILKMGKDSAAHLKTLLQTGKSYDYEIVDKDRYGRKYCIIHTEHGELNKKMLYDGYALPIKELEPKKQIEYVSIALDAKSERKGLWGKYGRICTLR
jgi:endonuclease YncB( thermonuclease family)